MIILTGEMIIIYEDSVKSRFLFGNKRLIKQGAVDSHGDTIYSNLDNKIFRLYFMKTKKPECFYVMEGSEKQKEILFDSLGNIISLINPPLDFLTKKDSLDLDNAYPDWKSSMGKVIELKNKIQ